MSEDDTSERTEEATPKRLKEAREKGQAAHSKEYGTSLIIISGAVWFMTFGPSLVNDMLEVMHAGFAFERNQLLNPDTLISRLADLSAMGLLALVPFFIMMVIIAIVSSVSTGGWLFSTATLVPDMNRLDPIKGLGRIFSLSGLLELIKSIVKFVLIGSVCVFLIMHLYPELKLLDTLYPDSGVAHSGSMLIETFMWLAASTAVIAAVDLPYQLWNHSRNLRMTRQEIRDEMKDTEGKPEVKSRIRRLRYDMARSRMMSMMSTADVVITNPSHYAVALRYKADADLAPIVVAKGVELIAAEIRQRALADNITIIQVPSLARAIYHSTRVNQQIPAGLYLAVAKILTYVYQLRTVSPVRAGRTSPPSEADIFIPPELRV